MGYTYPGAGELPGATDVLTPGSDLSLPTDVFTDQQYLFYFQAEARIVGTGVSVWSNVVGPPAADPAKGGLVNAKPVNWSL